MRPMFVHVALLDFSINCVGESAAGIVEGLFTKSMTIFETREPIGY